MPIENLDNNQNQGIAKRQATFLNDKNVIIAGTLKVRHSLMPDPILLYGFIVEDYYFNSEDFKINGLKISYKKGDNEYVSNNEIIYQRVKINLSREKFTYETDLNITHRSNHKWQYRSYASIGEIYKYYLFDDNFSEIPVSVANNIFVVCKYRENSEFKYMILSLHEVVPVLE